MSAIHSEDFAQCCVPCVGPGAVRVGLIHYTRQPGMAVHFLSEYFWFSGAFVLVFFSTMPLVIR